MLPLVNDLSPLWRIAKASYKLSSMTIRWPTPVPHILWYGFLLTNGRISLSKGGGKEQRLFWVGRSLVIAYSQTKTIFTIHTFKKQVLSKRFINTLEDWYKGYYKEDCLTLASSKHFSQTTLFP